MVSRKDACDLAAVGKGIQIAAGGITLGLAYGTNKLAGKANRARSRCNKNFYRVLTSGGALFTLGLAHFAYSSTSEELKAACEAPSPNQSVETESIDSIDITYNFFSPDWRLAFTQAVPILIRSLNKMYTLSSNDILNKGINSGLYNAYNKLVCNNGKMEKWSVFQAKAKQIISTIEKYGIKMLYTPDNQLCSDNNWSAYVADNDWKKPNKEAVIHICALFNAIPRTTAPIEIDYKEHYIPLHYYSFATTLGHELTHNILGTNDNYNLNFFNSQSAKCITNGKDNPFETATVWEFLIRGTIMDIENDIF